MGQLTAWGLVTRHGWRAMLAEPDPSTYAHLQRHFEQELRRGQVWLHPEGTTAQPAAHTATMYRIEARVSQLEATHERGLPEVTRQRLQWGTSVVRATSASVRGDLWLYNHLAGGPVMEALTLAGHVDAAEAFRACKQGSATRKARCYPSTIESTNVTLWPWSHTLAAMPSAWQSSPIDLLVVDLRDPSISDLLAAFPLQTTKPSLIYYRTGSKGVLRKHLLAHGYHMSAHWETSAWGEHTLAWRADRCAAKGMPGPPLWSLAAAGVEAARPPNGWE